MSSVTSHKGKKKAVYADDDDHENTNASGSARSTSPETQSESDVSSDSDSDSSDDESEEEITQAFLDSLLQKAKENARRKRHLSIQDMLEEEEIRLDMQGDDKPLPLLKSESLPSPYIKLNSRKGGPSAIRDLDAERVEKAASSLDEPVPPTPPPELDASGKKLTKKERKALKNKTAGAAWFDLPAPAEADLPRLYREVEALRLRNQLDPKRFYKRDEGEGKGIKGLPKHFAIGTIIPSSTPFGTPSADNLSRAHRKRTLVEELVDDAEAKGYAKKKFKELQSVRGARGRGTLAQRKALRRPKW
ncbi:Fcf2-domain-containing protein [Laetiporus sulphureus 93-53]|uniref:Fcf2-domain-containing protein n=1 Tax=Laetiporus sulphureus 93-53 TaxID=1314785 RepID=A0A165FS64_9APHY|nr:Fcf2-domain-containing protein [Laetiporus sulphureus 93-53]KZT09342.1 Fcf2-domain-containing protein [Laetiporus sulphureus 93-53]